MSHSQGRTGEPLFLDGGSLGKLTFQRAGDRYTQCWEFPGLLGEHALQSLESTSDVAWPVSPPLQQLHLQKFPDGREVIFGVGMAGRGHWSASFTLLPDLGCWIVELACRASASPSSPLAEAKLLSSYQVQHEWLPAEGHGYQCRSGCAAVRLEPASPGCEVVLVDQVLRIAPPGDFSVPATAAATHQWAFRIRVEQSLSH